MILFSHTLTPRLQYVVDFLSAYYGTPIRLLCDEENYLASTDPHRINYSYHRLRPNEVWIHSHVLLFESTVRPVKIDCFDHHRFKAFFKAEGDTGFDLLAGIFYLLSRYEEYLPHRHDAYGRFSHEESLAYREGFLHQPLIHLWLEDFRELLTSRFPDLRLSAPVFRFQPTYDIDIAWSFAHKGFARNAGSLAKLFFSGKWRSLAQRIRVIRGRQQDPFDAYDWMDVLHGQAALQPIYFFLVAARRSKFDRNTVTIEPAFQALIKDTAEKYSVGLHPSWASGDEATLLKSEKSWLQGLLQKPVTFSRQHYIRFALPETYRRLLAAGITDDYSMGYATINGFRASVATPFYWYDLKADSKTALLLHPFCFMDANAFFEERKTPHDALHELVSYAETVRSVGGTLITIWHNPFLGTDPLFAGWREVYEQFVSLLAQNSFSAATAGEVKGPRSLVEKDSQY